MKGNLKNFIYANFITGIFSFGGGVSFLSLLKEYYLDKYHFISVGRFYELFGYASAMPGPISPLFAAVVGYECFGILGYFAGIIALVFPSMLITIVAYKYYKIHKDNRVLVNLSKYLIPCIISVLVIVVSTIIQESLKYDTNNKYFHYAILLLIPIICLKKFNMTPLIPIILNIVYVILFLK